MMMPPPPGAMPGGMPPPPGAMLPRKFLVL